MPVNILITFIIESILGWILVKITRAPKNLESLIIGNLGNLPIIIIPAICKDKGSPFGDLDESLATRVIKHYNKLNQRMPLIYVKLYRYHIFRALSYIHRCIGVCHRDIKPQNLLIGTLTSDIANMNDVLLVKSAGLKKMDMGCYNLAKLKCCLEIWGQWSFLVLLFGVIAIEIKRKAPHCNRNS
ncbi:hypothetical protein AHAS_Ahas06G0188700 [Arachis hypogaea]